MSKCMVMFGYEDLIEAQYYWRDAMIAAAIHCVNMSKSNLDESTVIRVFDDYCMTNPYESVKSFEAFDKWIGKFLSWCNVKDSKKLVREFRNTYQEVREQNNTGVEYDIILAASKLRVSDSVTTGMIADIPILDCNKVTSIAEKMRSTYNYCSCAMGLSKVLDAEKILSRVLKDTGRFAREILIIDSNRGFILKAEEMGFFTYWSENRYIADINQAVRQFTTGRLY